MYQSQNPVADDRQRNWPVSGRHIVQARAGTQVGVFLQDGPAASSGYESCHMPVRSAYAAAAGRLVCLSVSALYGVGTAELMRGTRGKARASRARQIAMYVMHTSLSLGYQEVADFFHRDRTTVSHACAVVEDARDEETTDAEIALLDKLVLAAHDPALAEGEAQ